MRLSILGSSLTLSMIMLTATPVKAHHSFDAEYDSRRLANFTGVVTEIDWQNPHSFIFINYKDESGAIKPLRFELGPPYALVRGGWKRDTVKIGDTITVEGGALAKDPRNNWVGAIGSTVLVTAKGEKMTMR
jgi:Family of unknown function (DUF6152)